MNLLRLFLFVAITLSLPLRISLAGDDTAAAGIWKEGFIKRLDSGYLASALPDPRYPPQLELIFLSWNDNRLRASADYHNVGSSPVEMAGREIENHVVSSRDFYPYATLQVSNDKTAGWKVIGSSPSTDEGKDASVSIGPNSLRDHPRGVTNRACYIEMDALRPLIGKFVYGRVVLKNGAKSQLLVLTDLLPPKKENQ